jgi:hypothetical protein
MRESALHSAAPCSNFSRSSPSGNMVQSSVEHTMAGKRRIAQESKWRGGVNVLTAIASSTASWFRKSLKQMSFAKFSAESRREVR